MKIVVRFLGWTFLIVCGTWGSLILLTRCQWVVYGQVLFMVLYAIGGLSPCLAAFIVLRKDKAAARELRRSIFHYRIRVFLYPVMILLPLAVSGIARSLSWLLTGDGGPFLKEGFLGVLMLLPVMVIGGGLEEIGWRGVLLPQLLSKMHPWKAALLVSLIWGLWHIPLFFIPGVPQYGTSYAAFLVNLFPISFLLVLLYMRTRSVLACIFFHALENAYASSGLSTWAVDPVSRRIDLAVGLIVPFLLFALSFRGHRFDRGDNILIV